MQETTGKGASLKEDVNGKAFLFQSKKTHSVYQSCPFLIGRWINGFDLCTQHAYKGIEL